MFLGFRLADWEITAGKVINYIGDDHIGADPSYATGIEFHRGLADLTDDLAFVGDDIIDKTKPVPTKRSTDFILTARNGYTLTDSAIEHLYDVSITEGVAGSTQKIWDSVVVQGSAIIVNIIQNGAKLTDDWWNNDPSASGFGLNPDLTKGITHRFLVKVHDFAADGGDIDGRKLLATARPWQATWKESFINGTERGKNFVFLDTEDDLNNNTARATVGALVGITNQTEGRNAIDVDGDLTDEFYFSDWTYGANSINDLYEYSKYLADDTAAGTLYGLAAAVFRGITHKFAYDTEGGTGSWTEGGATPLTFGNGATGQLLAVKDDGTTGEMWIQLLTGDAPANNDSITQGTINALINGAVTAIPVRAPYIGQSTGSAIIGAYGQGIASILTPQDKLTDLDGAAVSPPNKPTFAVAALEIGDGSVTVYPWDGVTLTVENEPQYTEAQMTLATALTGAAETQAVVNAIPDNTPDNGKIRIILNSGVSKLVSYSSHNNVDTFTFTASENFSTDNASIANNSWIAYLDTTPSGAIESFNYTFTSNVNVVIEVRDPVNQMVPFITTAVLGDTGQTITTIRNDDF